MSPKVIAWMITTACMISDSVQPPGLTGMDRSLEQAGFERIGKDQGVTVYRHPETGIIHLAAEGRFAGSPSEVRDILLAYEEQVGQVERLEKSRILQRGPGWMLVYQRLGMPVISDRDYTLCVTWGADGDTLWIRYQAKPGEGPPPRPDAVRVREHRGSWQLVPVDGGRSTRARYETILDMAGWVPRWLAKSAAGGEVSKTYEDFRAMLHNGRVAGERAGP